MVLLWFEGWGLGQFEESCSRLRCSHPPGDSPCGQSDLAEDARLAGQHAVKLTARADVELGEDLAQVIFDRAGADEQPGADLGIGEPVAGEPRDMRLLGGELIAGLRRPLARGLA